jgi:hypothetical protein
MAKKKDWKVPLDKNGNLLHYARPPYRSYSGTTGTEWVEPFEFDATLMLDRMETGRSAKFVWWTDIQNSKQYPMFVSELMDIIRQGCKAGGVVKGRWKTVKRGQNFGIALVVRWDDDS